MTIEGLSHRRRLTRAGIIRLGIKDKKPGGKEYPKEVDYFVCPPLVREVYGTHPKELIIMFPVEDETMFFSQFYKLYGNGILLCRGDGIEGTFWDFDKGDFAKRACPCDRMKKGDCKPVGILQFMLPEVKESVGVWQISTSSKNSIIDINSGIDFVRGVAGRVAMIPLILKRDLTETHRIEGNNIKKGKHYTMKLSLAMSLVEIQRIGQLPPSQALLLPTPDESQEAISDICPPNGHKPEEEKTEDEKEETVPVDEKNLDAGFEDAELETLKRDLELKMAQYIQAGGEFTEAMKAKRDGLETAAQFKTQIKFYENQIASLSADETGQRSLIK